MKHYFQPYHGSDWGTVEINAPLDGTITRIDDERTLGQQVRIESRAMSDVAVELATPLGLRLVSYFDAMSDSVFAAYQSRGVASPNAPVISASERNAQPLTCDGEAFLDAGSIATWVDLP